jgi:leucyl/phenylalanyl-tRNA--protein transferase
MCRAAWPEPSARMFEVRVDTDFEGVIEGCSASCAGPLLNLDQRRYSTALWRAVRARGLPHGGKLADGELVGGLYGVALGGAFFGESMFSRARDASKVALVHLVGRLISGGFALLDTQFITEHLQPIRRDEIPADLYREALRKRWHQGRFLLLAALRVFRAANRCNRSAKRHKPGGRWR